MSGRGWILAAALLAVSAPLPGAGDESSQELNGFRIERLRVPREAIRKGGPDRDGIHSVDEPEFAAPQDASWVSAPTPVLGVEIDGVARVYPVHLMEHHQVVNDSIAGIPVVVTYGPLAGTPLA